MTFSITINWPDGKHITATLQAADAGESAPVTYTGDLNGIQAPTQPICSYVLQAILEYHAENTGGKITVSQDAPWPAMDEVK